MHEDLKSLLHATRDSRRSLSDLLPMYREAVRSADFRVRDFAVDSVLLRAAIAHASEWTDFVKQLEASDDYIRGVSWLGRTFGPTRDLAPVIDPAEHDRRRQTILWLIENHPETRVHQHVEATLNQPGDEEAYDLARSIWLKKEMESPLNVEILSNAASFFAVREPLLSRGFLTVCVKLQPSDRRWQRRLAKLVTGSDPEPCSGDQKDPPTEYE